MRDLPKHQLIFACLACVWFIGGMAIAQPKGGALPQPKLVELTEFHQDLRGSKMPVDPLTIVGAKAKLVTKPDERGLHIVVTANPQQTQRIGVDLMARFRGDFEITAGYEIKHTNPPTQGHGVGVSLFADLDSPQAEVFEVLRAARVNEGDVYGCMRKTVEAGKDNYDLHWTPTECKAGQLRITRLGAEVIYSAREDDQAKFVELSRKACGTEDIKHIRFAAYLGYAQNSLDVYLRDLQVGPPSAKVAVKPPVPIDQNQPAEQAAPAGSKGKAIFLVGGLCSLATVLALLLFVFARWRQTAAAR